MRSRFQLVLWPAFLAAALGASPAANVPDHIKLAEKMIAEIKPQNNEYKNGKYVVTWAGLNGATKTENQSDCTTYVTALLKTAYGFNDGEFNRWFGKSSPSIAAYYDSAATDRGLHGFKSIADLKPGDLLISKYSAAAKGGAAGHMMMVESAPVPAASGSEGLKTYDITIIDCTGAPHAHDSREKPQTGIGRGTMQVYVDKSGDVAAWSWSAGNRMIKYLPDTRPLIFSKIPSRN